VFVFCVYDRFIALDSSLSLSLLSFSRDVEVYVPNRSLLSCLKVFIPPLPLPLDDPSSSTGSAAKLRVQVLAIIPRIVLGIHLTSFLLCW